MRDTSYEETASRFALILDVDGVLTDDTVLVDKQGHTIGKSYCVEDFQVLKHLSAYISIYILTGEVPEITKDRLTAIELIHEPHIHYYHVRGNKRDKVKQIMEVGGYETVHFIGNSIFNDLPVSTLPNVTFFTPNRSMIAQCLNLFFTYDYMVLATAGGHGAVCDWFCNHFIEQEEEIWNETMSHLGLH